MAPKVRREANGGGGLALGGNDRLPWLESPDDFDDAGGIDRGRLARFVLVSLAVLALIVGGVWWLVRTGGPGEPDGSLIRAPAGPYKVRPERPGGKTFAGTGDSSYAVSEGENSGASLAEVGAGGSTDQDEAGADAGGVGVQVGAYMDREAAEVGWQTLTQRNPVLAGVSHRIISGRADIGTLYRLQAVTASEAAAQELCRGLREAGQDCQVKP